MSGAGSTGRLTGRVAVVTGASRGIGKAIAHALAAEGAKVIAAARGLPLLEAAARGTPGVIVPRVCDVTRAAEVRALIASAEDEFGTLDILVNNAGIEIAGPLVEMTEDAWDATMATNVKGMFLGCKYAIPVMIRAGGGSIVNIGSITCFTAEKLNAAYVTSKGAVAMLTKSAACEYAKAGVRVNVICPGATATPMLEQYGSGGDGQDAWRAWMSSHQPLTGVLPAEAVAKVAVFLASDDAKGMTGASIVVDGGLSASWDHSPRPGDPEALADA
jgi:NAD(P)-dependent dehydrogenase (short-subunit alcohol dehydrogenase family)